MSNNKKLIISAYTLLKAARTVARAHAKNTALPILDNILMEVCKGELTLTVSYRETSIRTKVSCESQDTFKFMVPVKMLIEILSNMEDQPLTISVDNKKYTVEISTDYGKFNLTGFDAEDFPIIPPHTTKGEFQLSSKDMQAVCSKVGFCMGADEIRPVMMGILFEFTPDKLNAVATDAHKLAVMSFVCKANQPSFIMPKRAVSILQGLIEGDESLKFEYDDTQMEVRIGKTIVNLRLMDGKYPNYAAVLPKNEQYLTVNRKDLLGTIRQALVSANQTTYQVRMRADAGTLHVECEDLDFCNEASIRLNAEWKGTPDFSIGFNGKFLLDVLSRCEEEKVKFELSKPNRAAVISEGNALYLIMPVELKEAPAAPDSEEVEEEEATPKKKVLLGSSERM